MTWTSTSSSNRERAEVAQGHLQDGDVEPVGLQLLVRVADGPEVLDACLLQVRQVGGVVDDAHGVGLGEADPHLMGERVARRVGRRVERDPGRHRPGILQHGRG